MSRPTSIVLQQGTVTCVEGFLSDAECRAIIADLRHTWWWASTVIRPDRNHRLVSAHSVSRLSSSTDETWLDEPGRRILRRIEHRLARSMGAQVNHFEPWQVTRYRAGERFDEHHDGGFFDGDRWGERTVSVVIYLTDSPKGGSTYFPHLGLRFQPIAGRLILWPNLHLDGSVDERLRHAACPARRVKMILSTWVRERPTRSIASDEGRGWHAEVN
jgi:hypothetical protein